VSDPVILLTNDDGIDAVGLRALYDRLADRARVVAVAPDEDRSGAGLTMNTYISVAEHELGYRVGGTPADCVQLATGGLELDPDLVVSGCNPGPNIGAHTLGRSGTVGAAMEAGLSGVPALAVSLYDPERLFVTDPPAGDYAHAVDAAAYLVDRMFDGSFGAADYVNAVVPTPTAGAGRPTLRITRPSRRFEIYTERSIREAVAEDGEMEFRDRFWEGLLAGEVEDPVGTDRRAVADGEVSVSPLQEPHVAASDDGFASVGEGYTEWGE
jgi:5'-nucleotidase